uniref:transcription termination factor MTERF5, chloroplastic-like n=1 Tax=Erigeron canadensis TaxID=72917 RepID=UPI001CB9591F|nr:transcription termination factor MTERF5, chloroplastic-like [Erigeron canadensis]
MAFRCCNPETVYRMLAFKGRHRLLNGSLFSASISNNNNGGLFVSSQILHLSPFSSSNNQDSGVAKAEFLVDFLIVSVGFTKEAAISISRKVPLRRFTKSPQLVINIFKDCGLNNTHIKQIISCVPKILNCRPHQTLEPKFRAFRDYGFSGSDIVELIKGNPSVLRFGLSTRIVPVVEFVRRFVGSNEELIQAINKSKRLFMILGPAQLQNVLANVSSMQVRGLSNKQIVYFITKFPQGAQLYPSHFKSRLVWIVQELGIPDNSPMFIYALHATIGSKESTLVKKIDILRSYKWSEDEIATFVASHPKYFSYSEDKIHQGLNFFMKELGYAPAHLAAYNYLLGLSLQKRVKPRYKVLEILKEHKLVDRKPSLASLTVYPEPKFLKFLKRFEDELPGLVKTYTNSIRKTQSEKDV